MATMKQMIPRSLNEEQIKEIKDAFDLFDIDGTGRADPKEICVALHTLGIGNTRDEIRKIINDLENTTKPSIDFSDFLKLVNATLQDRDPVEEIEKAFSRFDDDATDRISFRNLKRVALELGEQLTDGEINDMIKAADEDLDGEISREEFIKLMQKAQLL
ncbi:Caltractin [Tritrichomonas foetus]|uniref:Caltractin n=1 Tax=Tritrichomonas foetus TaxID=1144522 RepID=A0A1J4JGF3_9EUKA|nr:Caltractin [Tritrichomonas foetus]|eukprot:OHS98226.1 Caltractin [Tritrichomonas foetus]